MEILYLITLTYVLFLFFLLSFLMSLNTTLLYVYVDDGTVLLYNIYYGGVPYNSLHFLCTQVWNKV